MKTPFVSIIVPVTNEEGYIIECLNSLFRLDYPKDKYEIVVVADKNATKEVFIILDSYKGRIKLVKSLKSGSAANRNLGVASAGKKSKLFAFTDADCIVDKNWLKSLVEKILDSPKDVGCVGGINLVPDSDNPFAKTVGAMEQTLVGGGGTAQSYIQTREKSVVSIPNCNALYRKELWLKNRQDEELLVGQDGEFNYRLWRKGVKFIIIPEAIVWHHRTKTLKGFIRRMFRYGAATAKIFRKHKEMRFLKLRWYGLGPAVALVVLVALLILSFFGQYTLKSFQALLFLSGVYMLIDIMTSISVLFRTRKAYSLISILLLPLQHLVYAIGFFKGLIA